jgi:hypothetical protein
MFQKHQRRTLASVLLSFAGSPSGKCTTTNLLAQASRSGKMGTHLTAVTPGFVGWRGTPWAALNVACSRNRAQDTLRTAGDKEMSQVTVRILCCLVGSRAE